MADTARTRAALQTLLADNQTGAISAQDLRDLLASVAISSDPQDVKKYIGFLLQSGENDPTMPYVKENSTGVTPVPTRISTGLYSVVFPMTDNYLNCITFLQSLTQGAVLSIGGSNDLGTGYVTLAIRCEKDGELSDAVNMYFKMIVYP